MTRCGPGMLGMGCLLLVLSTAGQAVATTPFSPMGVYHDPRPVEEGVTNIGVAGSVVPALLINSGPVVDDVIWQTEMLFDQRWEKGDGRFRLVLQSDLEAGGPASSSWIPGVGFEWKRRGKSPDKALVFGGSFMIPFVAGGGHSEVLGMMVSGFVGGIFGFGRTDGPTFIISPKAHAFAGLGSGFLGGGGFSLAAGALFPVGQRASIRPELSISCSYARGDGGGDGLFYCTPVAGTAVVF